VRADERSKKKRVRALVTEALGRFFSQRADVLLVTHAGYARDLGKGREAHVLPASWIRDRDVLEPARAIATWDQKSEGPVRALFAGRLVADKGVNVILDALPHLTGANVELTCMGEGPLADELRKRGVRVLDPVPYGEQFFEIVRSSHAVLVPTLSDEQPRILYDAASQAVSCIASDTLGNRAMLHERNSVLVPPGDARALAAALSGCTVDELRIRGLRALVDAAAHTHEAMHERRRAILVDAIAKHEGKRARPRIPPSSRGAAARAA
jgi:glycosyltransferase involved in cell wall biosynthesis